MVFQKVLRDQVISSGLHLVSRLRDDADMKYLCTNTPTGKRGRPRKYTGKIDISEIDRDYFTFISGDDETTIYAEKSIAKP